MGNPEAYQWPHEIVPPIWFANSQWAVTDYGIECLTSYYIIDAKRLGMLTDRSAGILYDWPVHLAEKTWVDLDAFAQAFEFALRHHAKAYKGTFDKARLAASLAVAREERDEEEF
jgi:hypothetical protein